MSTNDSMRWKKILSIILCLVLLAIPFAWNQVQAEELNEDIVDLRVLYTNDIHASIDGFGAAAAYINEQRNAADYSLYLDAGDIFSGNPVVDLNYGKPIIEILNLVGVDAMTIGNHEFDYGQEIFAERMEESNFPWMAANMEVFDESIAIKQPKPYEIFDVNGVNVAVFSLTQAPPSTAPAGVVGIDFEADYAAVAKQYQEELEGQSDIIIALTHIGHNDDRRLAEEVNYFDVIIGGHSHTLLNEPAIVNGTPIVQTNGNLNFVGNLNLQLNTATNEVTVTEGFVQRVNELTNVDEDVQAVIDEYNEEMNELLGEVIGYSDTGLSRDGRYEYDAPLGNFWTDAMSAYADTDFAITNNGGIRDSIAPGEVTVGDIYAIEPFANEIMVYEMTGQAIKDVLAFSYSRGDRHQIDLQASGFEYEIVAGPVGNLLDVNLTRNEQPLDLEERYTIAVPDYIGTGGSGYEFEGTIVNPLVGQMTTAMIDYAKELTENGEAINYIREGRIKISVDPSGPMPGEVIGTTDNGLFSSNKNIADVGMGNLYTDAIRDKADADIALLNGSSVSGEIPAGYITDKQIEALDRFGNEIVVLETTGAKLKEVILSQSSYHRGVDLQASGIKYQLIPSEGGSGMQDVLLFNEDGTELDLDANYTVAYNDYMHGQGFYRLSDSTLSQSEGTVWEATVEYIQNHDGAIDYIEGERISIEGVDLPDGDRFLTVAEAIAQNSGIANVRGYIVGSINSNQVILGEGTHAASNLLLADDPNETDREKMLPVQLVNGTTVRTGLNLVSHPDNLGKYVSITGSLEAYFQTPGMRNPSAFTFEAVPGDEEPGDDEEEQEPQGPLSVEDALNQSEGEVEVSGYVVGNARSKNHVALAPAYYDDLSVLIADDPNETDQSKMMIVQLKPNDRASYGLVTNPELHGEKVTVLGERDHFKGFEAVKHPEFN
ncbi:5'-nucleotidase C-terminal domain-containing protein [Alkalihalophilus pseudofirmus]|uniref:5'-nucleotidase C-terminal domain-containing protein n=1 Tax=Alkalihalophilus pseudofirmus TaxID=79885 RepID=A0AAJ2U436_ALKPS|nr:5'-nucleotidase C-terminal domain-containing protein [Alkalihalophilus pseudofirmus]MDV2886797.1 5'-nucleotidase C-terminal domain-containing protein [Alkalihalophilus pseudofirmus]